MILPPKGLDHLVPLENCSIQHSNVYYLVPFRNIACPGLYCFICYSNAIHWCASAGSGDLLLFVLQVYITDGILFDIASKRFAVATSLCEGNPHLKLSNAEFGVNIHSMALISRHKQTPWSWATSSYLPGSFHVNMPWRILFHRSYVSFPHELHATW